MAVSVPPITHGKVNEWLSHHHTLPPVEQVKLARSLSHFPNLPPEEEGEKLGWLPQFSDPSSHNARRFDICL